MEAENMDTIVPAEMMSDMAGPRRIPWTFKPTITRDNMSATLSSCHRLLINVLYRPECGRVSEDRKHEIHVAQDS